MKSSRAAGQASLEGIGAPDAYAPSARAPSLAGRVGQVEMLVALLKARRMACAAEARSADGGNAPACPTCVREGRRLEELLGGQEAVQHILMALIECGHADVGGSCFAAKLRRMKPDASWTDAAKEGYVAAKRNALEAVNRRLARRGR